MSKTILLFCVFVAAVGAPLANPMRPDPINSTPSNTTVAPTVVKQTIKWPRLDGVVIIGDYRKAIFNQTNEVLLGESIAGYQLVDVEKDYVVLKRGSTIKKINLTTTGALSITPSVEE